MNDLIKRQDAIEVLATMQGQCTSKAALIQNSKIWQQIKDLPSVQPEVLACGEGVLEEPGVIRCRDCKWWGYGDDDEGFRMCHAAKHRYFSAEWNIDIYRTYKGDFYCADAERRDEEDG